MRVWVQDALLQRPLFALQKSFVRALVHVATVCIGLTDILCTSTATLIVAGAGLDHFADRTHTRTCQVPVKRGITRDYTPLLLILQGWPSNYKGLPSLTSNITREVTHLQSEVTLRTRPCVLSM